MRSPVGWLCFGIFVVCVISVESGVSAGNYQIIHGHGLGYPGAIFQRIAPKTGYRSVVPISVGRRIIARMDVDDEEDSEPIEYEPEEEEEEDVVHGPSHPHQHRFDEERDREEEEEAEEDEGLVDIEVGGITDTSDEDEDDEFEEQYLQGHYGRQAYRNNIRKPSTKLRTSLQKSSSKEGQLSPRKSSKKSKKSKKKTTLQTPEEISPIKAKSKNTNTSKTPEINENHKQKYQLKANSHAHQFVATPIADLILKLSISLARPIGNANGTATYFNVPIRLFNTGTELKNISALNASMSKVEPELHKTNSIVASPSPLKVVSVPIKTDILDNQEIDDKEDHEDEDTEEV